MKKYITYAAFIAATMLAAACGNKNEEEATSENVQDAPTSGISIAYVELDTLMSQYQLYKDYSEVLTRTEAAHSGKPCCRRTEEV